MLLGTTEYLIGLIAILVPIAIHLWSKKTRKTIPFGTVRFLNEDDTQAIKSLIPTEWLLLLLRVMMLIVLVLIMSEPLWQQQGQAPEMVLIDPAYESHPNLKTLKDSLKEQTEVRWFSPGFPAIDDSISLAHSSHWELISTLAQVSAEKITVLSPQRIAQFKGERKQASRVNWTSLPEEQREYALDTFTAANGSIAVSASTNSNATVFTHLRTGDVSADSMVVTISIQSDDVNEDLVAFVNASIEAINEDSPLQIRLTDESEAEWLFWLKAAPVPERQKLIFATDQPSHQLIKKVSQDVYAIATFELEDFLSKNFPILLEQVLAEGEIDIDSDDMRVLPESQLPNWVENIPISSDKVTSAKPLFWVLLIVILLIERFYSYCQVANS